MKLCDTSVFIADLTSSPPRRPMVLGRGLPPRFTLLISGLTGVQWRRSECPPPASSFPAGLVLTPLLSSVGSNSTSRNAIILGIYFDASPSLLRVSSPCPPFSPCYEQRRLPSSLLLLSRVPTPWRGVPKKRSRYMTLGSFSVKAIEGSLGSWYLLCLLGG